MNDVDRQIRVRIERFVSELNELVRQSALEAVADALGAEGARHRGAASPAVARRRALGPRSGAKRSPEQIDQMAGSVLSHVRNNPGQGVEQIAHELNTSTRELTLPIKKLLAHGDLITEGQKRATKYFASGGGGSAISGASGVPRRRRARSKAKGGGRKRRARA